MGFGVNFMSSIFPVIFIIIFTIVIGTFIVTAVKGIGTWSKNNNSPVLTVDSSVVSKRISVTHHNHNNGNNMHNSSSSTDYYVTFQVESGDRIELKVNGGEYGILVEGDRGKLTFQGSRYKEFQRIRG